MLKDEGNTIDPISGNEVPPGAMQEEVRDDVPAQLSEGEFVFPADVVRYWGLSTLMQMRQEAKQGLSQMDAMGQMGNSEEAVIPDDVGQFPIPDVNIDELMQQQPQQQMAAKGGDIKKFKEGGDVSYEDVMGTSPFEIPALSSVPTAYINKKTGEIIYLPHDAEGNLMIGGGKPPAGYELASEADLEDTPEEVQAPQVEQVQAEDNSDNPDKLGNNPEYSGGGTRIAKQDFAVKYGADGQVFIASEESDRKAGFSSPQWMELTPEVAGELGFTDNNKQGVSKDSLIKEASFGTSAGGWLGNPEREGAKETAQKTISGFINNRNNADGLLASYQDHLFEKNKQKQVTNDKYFGGINKVLNTVGDLVKTVSNPASLVAQKVASGTATASNNNNNNDVSQVSLNQEQRTKDESNEAEKAYKRARDETKSPIGNPTTVGSDRYKDIGKQDFMNKGGLASKKKKYSKGGKVKKSKKGLATQLELGI
tara:strand:- start:798 stop:2240 length:1443 start_codon:yes stop_codon:yes gene_type:complete